MINQFHKWRLLSWWQKTKRVSGVTFALAVFFAVFASSQATGADGNALSKWLFCFLVFPLLMLGLMALLVRIQRKIDIHDGFKLSIDGRRPRS